MTLNIPFIGVVTVGLAHSMVQYNTTLLQSFSYAALFVFPHFLRLASSKSSPFDSISM